MRIGRLEITWHNLAARTQMAVDAKTQAALENEVRVLALQERPGGVIISEDDSNG